MTSSAVAVAEWPDAVIVVVDDEPLICRVMEQVLASRGYRRVLTFEDPTEALARFAGLAPDLVLGVPRTRTATWRWVPPTSCANRSTTELLLRVRYQLREPRLRRELAEHADHLGVLVDARAGELALLSRVLDEMPLPAVVVNEELDLHHANARGTSVLDVADGDLPGVLAVDDARREEIADTVRNVGRTPRRIPVVVGSSDGTGHRAGWKPSGSKAG